MTSTSPPRSLHERDQALRALPELSPWSLQQALDPATLGDTRAHWSDLGL